MAYLEWSSDFETGIPGIDYEHRLLVDMLNAIHVLIVRGGTPQTIADVLGDFHALAATHFALEEKIMQDENCADLQERKDIHRRLLDQVSDIMDAHETGGSQSSENLPATLKEWLLEAMTIDAKLFAGFDDAGLRRWGLGRH